jgi:hypothetical protein
MHDFGLLHWFGLFELAMLNFHEPIVQTVILVVDYALAVGEDEV